MMASRLGGDGGGDVAPWTEWDRWNLGTLSGLWESGLGTEVEKAEARGLG